MRIAVGHYKYVFVHYKNNNDDVYITYVRYVYECKFALRNDFLHAFYRKIERRMLAVYAK